MIASGQRVVMLSEGNTGDVPWYHAAYDGTMQETPYNWPAMDTPSGIEMLTYPAPARGELRPNRGGTTGPLFLMNHWVSGNQTETVTPDPAAAAVVNQKDAVVNRARACQQRRGIKPTILAVDFFGAGDVVGAARELNGVVAAPFLQVGKPKRAVVRAGRRAIFRVPITNIGDADATGVKVCATVPKRIARKPRCVTARVPVGLERAVRINVATKKRRKGNGKVKITVRAQANNLSITTSLRVKPSAAGSSGRGTKRAKCRRRLTSDRTTQDPSPLLGSRSCWAHSSVGRAPPRHGGGHWFEPSCAH